MAVQVWRVPINSQRQPDFVEVTERRDQYELNKAERSREFCFQNGWVGIGWGIDGIDSDFSEHERYIAALDNPPGNITFPPNNARGPSFRFAHNMQAGDFVWCRAKADTYWLGRITGPWQYKYSGDFDNFDLYQVRACEWHRVGSGDLVPGPIKNAYAGRGGTLSRIVAEGDAALLASALIWEGETQKKVEFDKPNLGDHWLSAIGHDDLEDIVALYLQIKLNWHIVPSTAKKSTPNTEFVLRNTENQRAYVQVKSGATTFEVGASSIPDDVDKFFIFYPAIQELNVFPNGDPRAVYIKPSELIAFARVKRALMPRFVQLLLDNE